MEIIAILGKENEGSKNYKIRRASRAVVFDSVGNVALLHVSKKNYYKLPGGGVEEGEDLISGLKRECLEEIGCNIEVKSEIGLIIEYRDYAQIKQESFCYLAEVVGEKGNTSYTESETEKGFALVWVGLDKAIELIDLGGSSDDSGKLVAQRELLILNKVKLDIKGRR